MGAWRSVERANVSVVPAGVDGREPPRIVGRCALYGEIASGGMASVHFARFVGADGVARTVAVKRAHPHLARETDFALMFLDEARLASRIQHPNVVPTLDVLAVPPELLLVMEYVHGESLWKLVRTSGERAERIPAPIAAAILVDTLRGLHAAHEATDEHGAPLRIVHRDVSPQNILVGADGISRLVDFGIAKAVGRLHSTRDSSVKGKYAYMAPEQVHGEPVSRLTDTYAAGIVFWELLTGERLFAGKTEAETIHKCLVGRVLPPSRFAPDLAPAIDEITKRALSRDPARRYATAHEMAVDIEVCLPPAERSEVGAWVRRMAGDVLRARAAAVAGIERDDAVRPEPNTHRRTVAIAVALGVVGALGSAVLVATRRAAEPAASRADTVTETAPEAHAAPPADTSVAAALQPVRPAASAPPTPRSRPPRAPARAPAATNAVPSRARRPRPGSCDPPYSIDSAGRQIFKPECM